VLNQRVERIARREGVDLVGFADLSAYADDLVVFGGDIVKGYPYGISIGIVLPNEIVEGLADRDNPNNASLYHHHAYDIINSRLDLAASLISSFLSREGHRALPVPAERTDIANAIPTVSHKMVGHIAGLGWIGKNCLLITSRYGPRIRLASILTDAPLKAVDDPRDAECGVCRSCVEICPAKAIRGREYTPGEPRGERFVFTACQDYFRELEKDTSKKAVCGMCLHVCPHGRTRRVGQT
jgi:epoxyqueuosine reductase QueG